MEYRGVRYVLRLGIVAGDWLMVIYPPNTNPIEKRVKGSRQVAERTAHSTIGTWLDLHQTHGR
jgi:hypothetical protein